MGGALILIVILISTLAAMALEPSLMTVLPESGEVVLIRGIGQIGRLEVLPYFEGEPEEPPVLTRWRDTGGA